MVKTSVPDNAPMLYPPATVMKFDGTDDYIDCGNGDSLNLTKTLTVEAWVRCEPDEYGWVFSKGIYKHGDCHYSCFIQEKNNYINLYYSPKDEKVIKLEWPYKILERKWHHIAIAFDAKTACAFIDGQSGESKAVKDAIADNGHLPFRIGFGQDEGRFFHGQIAEVRVWNVARTADEIKTHMSQRLRGDEPGLVGYWPLDDGPGLLAKDKTEYGNDGTVYGATWITADDLRLAPAPAPPKNKTKNANSQKTSVESPIATPEPVSVLTLDGSTTYIEIPHQAAFNSPQFTVSCWAKVTGGKGSWRSPITSRGDHPPTGYMLYAGEDNKWHFWVGDGQKYESYVGSKYSKNTWTHIAGSYDGSVIRFYVNGQQEGSMTSALRVNGQYPLRIGAGSTEASPQYFFKGHMAEVQVWNKPLTAEEIKASMSQRRQGNEPGLVGYWPLDEGSGSTATDKTQSDNHGTIHGSATWGTADDLQLAPATIDPTTHIPAAQPRTLHATGLEDYNYWLETLLKQQLAKQDKNEAKKPYRRGRIWT